jgi:hypothetical protein
MVSRAAAGLVLIAMLTAGATPCAGWQASAQARHDCCQDGMCPGSVGDDRAQGEHSQATADRCCATSEEKSQRDASRSVVAFFAVPAPAPLDLLPRTDPIHPAGPPLQAMPVALHAPPLYVLFSVFLV